MKYKNIVKYKSWRCLVRFNRYHVNGRHAITLEDWKTGEPISIATVNLIDENILGNQVAIDEPNNPGMTKTLQDAGIIGETIRMASSGRNINKYPIVEFLIQKQ